MHSTSLRTSSHTVSSRVGGLTGLRALAVLAVLGYHLLPDAVPGGSIGVDVFFVVSGFIVTRLLLVEFARTGRIALRAFWVRRARRIVPALVAVLAVCIPLAFVVDVDLLSGIRRQIIGAVTFSSNWLAIAADGDYFRAEQPELFTNLWSLAVEEQFYLLSPVVLIVVLLALRLRSRPVVIGALVLAGCSAVAMGLLSGVPFGSPTRAYFGTDTHAFGLLIGVALALALGASDLGAASGRRAAMRCAVGGTSLVVLIVLSAGMASSSWFPAHGGFLLASIATAGLVWAAATVPVLGRMLDVAPLRWLGERSYAVYLWHWPLLLILGATPLGSAPLALAAGTAFVSVIAAAVSFVVIEAPFRRGHASPALPHPVLPHPVLPHPVLPHPVLPHPVPHPVPHRVVVSTIAGALVGALALGGVAIAVGHDDSTDAEQLVARGRAAIEQGRAQGREQGRGDATAPPSSPSQDEAVPTTTPTAVAPTSEPILGTDITAVGDSVMLAAAPELQAAFPGIAIDADVSRSMWAAPEILSRQAADGVLRPIVVVGLATNGEVGADLLGKVLGIIGPDRTLVLVNGHADRSWIPGANADLAAFAAANPPVVVADWDSAIAPHPDELAGDGIHPQPAGGTVYAGSVTAAVVAACAAEAAADAATDAVDDTKGEGGPAKDRGDDATRSEPTDDEGSGKETPAP